MVQYPITVNVGRGQMMFFNDKNLLFVVFSSNGFVLTFRVNIGEVLDYSTNLYDMNT